MSISSPSDDNQGINQSSNALASSPSNDPQDGEVWSSDLFEPDLEAGFNFPRRVTWAPDAFEGDTEELDSQPFGGGIWESDLFEESFSANAETEDQGAGGQNGSDKTTASATSDEEPLHTVRYNIIHRSVASAIVLVVDIFLIDIIWSFIQNYEPMLWHNRFSYDTYTMAIWLFGELFFTLILVVPAGIAACGVYVANTYHLTIYSDRVEQRSKLFLGIDNPYPEWKGNYVLRFDRVRRVNIGKTRSSESIIDFYIWGRKSPFINIPITAENHHTLIVNLLDVLPDHVEVVGDQELISRYRNGEEFSWWKKMFIG